jgi:hypothetical protein
MSLQADAADINAKIQKFAGPNRTILHTYKPSPEAISKLSNAPFLAFLLPCFWPHLCLLSTCLCYCKCYTQQALRHTTYIVTDKDVIFLTEDFSDPCCCCCTYGNGNPKVYLYFVLIASSNSHILRLMLLLV